MRKTMGGEVVVPDTSALIEGKISAQLKQVSDRAVKIVVPKAVIDELQAQASRGSEHGWAGLDELVRVRKICERSNFQISFRGSRPDIDDIRLANSGRIDSLIIEVAKGVSGVLYTADHVQARVAEAEGVQVVLIKRRRKRRKLGFEAFFSSDTLSVHLKDGVPPFAKRGLPGKFSLVKIRENPCTSAELKRYIKEVQEAASKGKDSFTEVSMRGANVIQLGLYRVAIARPPFSDGLELTIVRPIVELRLEDYALSQQLMQRLKEKAEGILIAGPPGSGKTTFASSLAEFYSNQGKIVKTLESPRDLQVGPHITQYSPLEGSFEKTADILLLVRPDYSIFDEVRQTEDFSVFADLRSAGVGMIGVVHASNPIDALQRFMTRLELGTIPQTIDTIIFVKYGRVEQVLTVSLTVRVPAGMVEPELSRPIVELKNFETNELEYEIYTFGEEKVVVPIKERAKSMPVEKLAIERILAEIAKFDPSAEVQVTAPNRALIRVNEDAVPLIIGRGGSTISDLEQKLSIGLDVKAKERPAQLGITYKLKELRNRLEFVVDKRYVGGKAKVQIDGHPIGSFKISRKGRVTVPLKSDEGRKIIDALGESRNIKLVL
ncbi:ATPase, T2SS/T4P/T4SS family [[Eubacterium] cellulosolvens]